MKSVSRVALWLAVPASVIVPSVAQTPVAPVLSYEMDVSTTSGLAGGMGSLTSIMGGGGAQHAVDLRLSSAGQTAAPRADHFFLPAAGLGKSVPLTGGSRPGRAEDQPMLSGNDRPKGRILIFWGCGAKAGPGQPFVLDAAKLMPAQLPPQLGGTIKATQDTAPARTMVSWPGLKKPPAGSSLLGAHRVVSNFGPEIAFTLAQDYMPALSARMTTQADGSVMLDWTGIAAATGYAASAVGGIDAMQRGGDVVFWSRFPISDGLFREIAIGNRFWESRRAGRSLARSPRRPTRFGFV